MKALYIELAVVWAMVAFFNFAFFSMSGSWISFIGGVCSVFSAAANTYFAGKKS